METAFHLLKPRPAVRTGRLSGIHCASAVNTADARVIAVVQRVIGKLIAANMVPNCLCRPIRKRVYLCQPELGISLQLARMCTIRGLLPADAGDPGPQF